MSAEVIARVHKMASRNIGTKEGLKIYDKTGLEEDEDEEKMGDETKMSVEPPNNNAATNEMILDPPTSE